MNFVISAKCNKFYTKNYGEFKIVLMSFIPFIICVPVYSGN